MLRERYSVEFLRDHMLPADAWRPFPKAGDRAAWEALMDASLNRERRGYVVGQAECLLGKPWPVLPATVYMDFVRNGNRSRYEGPYFERRRNLAALVLAECFEGNGRFLDEIINGIWAICDEATWCVPAHARHAPDPLPDTADQMVDLFAAETGMVLAETCYLLEEQLAAISPEVVERLKRQVEGRVLRQVEAIEFSWFGGFNNWTPWIASNVLGAGMYLITDLDRLAALADRMALTVDRFIGNYGHDGGCDEGPSYWGVAAGAMLRFLELLYSRTEGAVDVYGEPLIRNMGNFIADTHLAGPWFTNFADAPARLEARRDVTYRYGERIGSQRMKDIALLSARGWNPQGEVYPVFGGRSGGALNSMLREIFWVPADAVPANVPNDLVNWFPDLQVVVARESEVLGKGLALAAKGGHNGESHNHNDIGQFILMLDGEPAIIDIGVETYTRKTFSPERYDIWCIRASGHNVPLVNGTEQVAGRDRRASNVTFAQEDGVVRFGLNLEGAYPEGSGIESLRREFTFQRKPASVTVRDAYRLATGMATIDLPFYTPMAVECVGDGRIELVGAKRRLAILFDPAAFQAEVADVAVEDARLQSSWGNLLRRITLRHAGKAAEGAYSLTFNVEG